MNKYRTNKPMIMTALLIVFLLNNSVSYALLSPDNENSVSAVNITRFNNGMTININRSDSGSAQIQVLGGIPNYAVLIDFINAQQQEDNFALNILKSGDVGSFKAIGLVNIRVVDSGIVTRIFPDIDLSDIGFPSIDLSGIKTVPVYSCVVEGSAMAKLEDEQVDIMLRGIISAASEVYIDGPQIGLRYGGVLKIRDIVEDSPLTEKDNAENKRGSLIREFERPVSNESVSDNLEAGDREIESEFDAALELCRATWVRQLVQVSKEPFTFFKTGLDEGYINVVTGQQFKVLVKVVDGEKIKIDDIPSSPSGTARFGQKRLVSTKLNKFDIEDVFGFGFDENSSDLGKKAALSFKNNGQILAHELGHAWPTNNQSIGLRHIETSSDGCNRDVNTGNIMQDSRIERKTERFDTEDIQQRGNKGCEFVNQVELLKDSVNNIPGCLLAGTNIPCEGTVVASTVFFTSPLEPRDVDPKTIGVVFNTDRILHRYQLFGVLSGSNLQINQTARYLAMSDLDNNPRTGGSAADFGLQSGLEGIDFVTEIIVQQNTPDSNDITIEPKVWTFDGNEQFTQIIDERIQAKLEDVISIDDDDFIVNSLVSQDLTIEIPLDILGEQVESFGFDAFSIVDEQVTGLDGGATTINTAIPIVATCSVSADANGGSLNISGAGLPADSLISILLAQQKVAEVTTDASGTASVDFQLPGNLPGGAHLVSMSPGNSQAGADCVVQVETPEFCQSGVDITPPVFSFVPVAIEVSNCSNPDIGFASATDECSVLVSNDAPAEFDLGPTLVTWSAVDPEGNVTKATQEVVAVLKENASCCPLGSNIILGTEGRDVILGTAGPDCIILKGGDDVVNSLGGDDFISGGAGRDVITSGFGNDYINGGEEFDVCFAPPGNDVVLNCP